MTKNPLTPLFSKIRKILFEETEDPMAPDGCREVGKPKKYELKEEKDKIAYF